MPTPLDTGHGGFTDGLFTKPSVGSYPSYLDKPEFCGPYIHATPAKSCPTIQYKSGTRAYIESQGYKIVGDFGDRVAESMASTKRAARPRRSGSAMSPDVFGGRPGLRGWPARISPLCPSD